MERWHLVTPRTPGKTRRNQLSLVGLDLLVLLGGCRSSAEPATEGGQRASKAQDPFPSVLGYGVVLPRSPSSPPCPAGRHGTILSHSTPTPGLIHPLTKATTLLHRPIMQTSHHPQPDHPQTGTWRGTRAVHRWWQSPQTQFFPKKPCLFPKACRRASGKGPWLPGWWLQLIPVRSSQRTCWAVNRCLLSTQDTKIGGNFTPESQLVQIWPGNYRAIGC